MLYFPLPVETSAWPASKKSAYVTYTELLITTVESHIIRGSLINSRLFWQ